MYQLSLIKNLSCRLLTRQLILIWIEIELQKNKEKILIIFYSDTYYSNNQRHYESLRNLEVIDIKKDELIDSERFISKKDAIDYIFSNYLDEKWKLI